MEDFDIKREAELRFFAEESEKEKSAFGIEGMEGTPVEIVQRLIKEAMDPLQSEIQRLSSENEALKLRVEELEKNLSSK